MTILIAYASKHGSTQGIAERIANEDGMIFCYHEKQKIRVLIKVGDRVLFDNKDVWGSVQ